MDETAAGVAREIFAAFPHVWETSILPLPYDAPQGSEAWEIAQAYAGKRDWTKLSVSFLDDNTGSGICFLPKTTFRFLMPAFMTYELAGPSHWTHMTFYLSNGLCGKDRMRLQRCGETGWTQAARCWAPLTQPQLLAIVHFIEFCIFMERGIEDDLREALSAFWYRRAAGQDVRVDDGFANLRPPQAKWIRYRGPYPYRERK